MMIESKHTHFPTFRGRTLVPIQGRGDKTPIELFIAGVQGWETALRRVFAGASEDAKSS
jgi:hypothetical protein